MLDWIDGLPPNSRVLDLGCGKLRYTIPLSKRVRSVVAVDSKDQIQRFQTIDGEKDSSVVAYAKTKLPNVDVFSLETKSWQRRRFDFVIVANVLSAIPNVIARLRVLRTAKGVLARNGRVLIVTNFANTRFRDWVGEKRAVRHLDGYLLKNTTGNSFYGLIPLSVLRRYCKQTRLTIESGGTFHGENAWVVASSVG